MANYIVLGSNNFWYASFDAATIEEAKSEVQTIKENPTDYSVAQPERFYLYEAMPVFTLEND